MNSDLQKLCDDLAAATLVFHTTRAEVEEAKRKHENAREAYEAANRAVKSAAFIR